MRSLILGHKGMVGSALHRLLPDADVVSRSFDLRWRLEAERAMSTITINGYVPYVVYLCAARVGGIQRNIEEPGQMIFDNLAIQNNVIDIARILGVKLVVFLGSSCIYPPKTTPISEDCLLTGSLEPTNEPYAIAKIAGIKMLEAYQRQYGMEFLAVMPCNLYGPGDNFDPDSSHFLPAMIRKFHEAKLSGTRKVTIWGDGTPRRELMHVDDCARIIVELVAKRARGIVNIGPGYDLTIADWADRVLDIVSDSSKSVWSVDTDKTKPNGVARKLMDVSRMRSFGVGPVISPFEGIWSTYQWFRENVKTEAVPR